MTTPSPDHVGKLAALGWEVSEPFEDPDYQGPLRKATAEDDDGRTYVLDLEEWDSGYVEASCRDSHIETVDGYEISTSMEELHSQPAAEWIKANRR